MRKVLVLAALIICSLFVPDTVLADARNCLKTPDAAWLDGTCFCPKDFQSKDGACEPAVCKAKPEDKAVAPVPKPTASAKTGGSGAEAVPPPCVSMSGEKIIPKTYNELVVLEFECEASSPNRTLKMVNGACEGCEVADRSGRVFTPVSMRRQKGKGPYREVFKVRPIDPENALGNAGTLRVTGKGKKQESPPVEVSILWPAKKPPAPPAPPPEPEDPSKIACLRTPDAKYDPVTKKCDCPEGWEARVWNDQAGNLHLCKPKPAAPVVVEGKKGDKGDPGETKIVYKGDASHLILKVSYLGLSIDEELSGGTGLSLGYSWGFGPQSRWHLTVNGGLLYLPTPRFRSDGRVARDAAGEQVKDNWGFLASASVSYTLHPNFSMGAGPSYVALGYRKEGRTFEFIGGKLDLVWYPVRGEFATMGIIASPQVGRLVSPTGSSTSAGVEVGAMVLF